MRILSWLYAAAVWVRNSLYDSGVLHVFKSHLPTICVGNLAVGGTGKTPHVEYLGQLLESKGYSFAILSRGYKRKSVGFVLADESSTVNTIGDESFLLKIKHPNWIVAVCVERVLGLRELRRRFPKLDCVILDDAFQHRRLKPGYSMILTQADRLYVEDELLPLGRLREPAGSSLRANMVVVTKCPPKMQPIDQRLVDSKLKLLPSKTLVFSRMAYTPLLPVFPETAAEVPASLAKENVLLLTGIAQPHYLYDHLSNEAQEISHLAFPDHHAFSERDMKQIADTFRQKHATLIITTEKDAVRLQQSKYFPDSLKPFIFSQPIEVSFLNDDKQVFDNNILRYVRQSTRNR